MRRTLNPVPTMGHVPVQLRYTVAIGFQITILHLLSESSTLSMSKLGGRVIQSEACVFIPKRDVLFGLTMCYCCRQAKEHSRGNGGVSRMRKDAKNIIREQCAFKGK